MHSRYEILYITYQAAILDTLVTYISSALPKMKGGLFKNVISLNLAHKTVHTEHCGSHFEFVHYLREDNVTSLFLHTALPECTVTEY